MAKFEKKPLHPFSRVKSDLAELQRWWPIHIKDDGVLGISIDPVLYRSRFSSNTETSDDESVQAGIRVEAIDDDGTTVSGIEPTIEIINSGTLNAKCNINHADGTRTTVRLVAPTNVKGGAGGDDMLYTDNNGVTQYGNKTSFVANGGHKQYRGGQYPIFMTVQELAETIDTYRHIGDSDDSQKVAWLPQNKWDTVHSSPAAVVRNPLIQFDPRNPVDATLNVAFPTVSPYRATVFMPMMLDNNQFSKDITNGRTLYAAGNSGWNRNGISRYDSDPEGEDSATIIYKKVGTSGDHLQGWNEARAHDIGNAYAPTVSTDLRAIWTSQDSSDCPAPKYRMAMALAAFLKDGTYSLNNGVIIPYVFDAARTIGGANTDTLYMEWDGGNGVAAVDATSYLDRTPAGIYPYFDFVQGPITPRAQGSNWTHAVLAGHEPAQSALAMECPPNTKKNSVDWIEVHTVSHTITGGTQMQRMMFVDVNAPPTSTPEPHGATPFEVGDAVYLSGMDGVLGSEQNMSLESGNIWGSRYDGRRPATLTEKDCNGWWIVSKVELDTPTAGHIRYSFNVRDSLLPVTGGYNPSGTIQMGRLGGPETAHDTTFYILGDGTPNDPAVRAERLEDMSGSSITNSTIGAMNPYMSTAVFHGTGEQASDRIGTGFQVGMTQGDMNVPIASSRNSTSPSRPTIGEASQITSTGEYIGDRPVPRSIAIGTLGVPTAEMTPNTPTIASTGNGSLRIPAPIGHDLAVRYEATGKDGHIPTDASNIGFNLSHTLWRVRQDATEGGHSDANSGGPSKWAWRGVSSPLWSFIDAQTGRHAWDYIKPSGWDYGRNRCWPAHERMGTRLSMSPSLLPDATGWTAGSGNLVEPAQETTKIGLSEIGCSPIFLDMEMTAFIPKRNNRLTIIEFDMNGADADMGRHHMIYETSERDMGFGFKPKWDGVGETGVWFNNEFSDIEGTTVTDPSAFEGSLGDAIGRVIDSGFATPAAAGYGAEWAGFSLDPNKKDPYATYTYTPFPPYPSSFVDNRPAVWFCPSATHFSDTAFQSTEGLVLPSTAGFGSMGTGFGQGPLFSYDEGINTVRTVFTTGGMTCIFNGDTIGTDPSAQEPIWGFQIKACNAFAFPNREPMFAGAQQFINSVDVGFPQYAHLDTEEPMMRVQVDNDIYNDYSGIDPVDTATAPTTKRMFVDNPTWATIENFYPATGLVSPLLIQDSGNRMCRADNPALQTSTADLQVDEIILRQIPTPAMLPFTVDTLKQQAVDVVSGLARYTSILIEADNISADKGMRVTVTLLEPPTTTGIAKEATTPITGFEDLDPDFIGGVGEVDLTALPTSAIVNGFVIRFNFYIPSSEQSDLHPIDWSATPIIRKYSVLFDHKPTAQNTIIGNTYDGSTATTVGQTTVQTFTTKVGHIISMRLQGLTTDADRKIKALKVDMGDGTITDFMPVTTPDTSAELDISHVYSSRPAGGTYDIKVYAQDDSDNESDYILIPNAFLRVTIVAAEPVAVLRAVPSMVRAGQAIRLDGSDSYTVDTSSSLSNFAWTFGDGSTGVNGATSHQDHTFAEAGEYMTTLIVTDALGTVSPYAKAVVKVLPATLIVPLTLSTKPSSFTRTRTAAITQTPILDAIYPEMTDMGQRGDEFTLSGAFLKETQETDIAFMEELLLSGVLVEFEYQEVNYTGVADSKTFTGRMVSFDYNRQGGSIDTTPYTASFVREAGLGA